MCNRPMSIYLVRNAVKMLSLTKYRLTMPELMFLMRSKINVHWL